MTNYGGLCEDCNDPYGYNESVQLKEPKDECEIG